MHGRLDGHGSSEKQKPATAEPGGLIDYKHEPMMLRLAHFV
jgi:hypothetical protein